MTALPLRRIPELSLGGSLAPELTRAITTVVVRQALGSPAAAEVAFADPPRSVLTAVTLGAALDLTLRGGGALFSGEVTGIEHELPVGGGRLVRVRAYDRLHRLRKRQRLRTIEDGTLASLLSEAAADVGVSASAPADAPARPLLIQHDQSDLAFLSGIAADSGLYLRLQDGVLDTVSLAGTDEPPLSLKLGAALLGGRVRTTAETLRTHTRAYGWDTTSLAPLDATAGLARQDAEEFRDGGLSAFPGLGERLLVNRVAADKPGVLGLAQDDMDRAAAAIAVLEATAQGDPELRPGRAVQMEGVADELDGRFVVTIALHRFDAAGGYVTELSTAAPAPPARSAAPAVTLAEVSQVDDPEQLGRARVKLPAYGGVETGWAPVMVMGAGQDKGAVVLPEVGDRVLALFVDGDPAHTIVLGGLYVGDDRIDALASTGKPRDYVFRTPSGQKLTLGGDATLARLETDAGDVLEFTAAGTRLTATKDLVIEAPGKRMTLRAAAVEFEKA